MTAEIARAPAAARHEVSRVSDRWGVLWATLALFVAALVVRLIVAEQQPVWTDELYHILAGRSLGEGRGLQVYEGAYTRDPLFTWLVSLLTPYYTWNLFIPRLPAVVAGALQVSLVFAWLRYRSDWIAAAAAALFLCLSEIAVQQSAYARFYSVHALFFWLAAAALYDLFQPSGPARRIWAGVFVVAGVAISLHLQPTTLFGLAGLGIWGAWMYFRSGVCSRRTNTILVSGLALLGLAGAALFAVLRPDLITHAIWEFTHTEQWNRKASEDLLYYVKYMAQAYPVMTSGFLVFAALAYRYRPHLTILCLLIVGITGGALSIAGMKSARYFLFALPFVFTICGLGVSEGWRLLARALPAGDGRRPFWLALAGVSLIASLSLSPGFVATLGSTLGGLKRAAATRSLMFSTPADQPWESLRAPVAAALSGRSVILTTEEFRTLRYFGAFDLALVPMNKGEGGKKDFVVDLRTGRPHISTPENVKLVYGCYPTGALLLKSDQWPASFELNADIQTFLDQHAQHQAFAVKGVPDQLHVVSWDHPAAPPTAQCEALRRRMGQGHRPAGETIARIAAEPDGGRIALRH